MTLISKFQYSRLILIITSLFAAVAIAAGSPKEIDSSQVWISLAEDAVDLIEKQHAKTIEFEIIKRYPLSSDASNSISKDDTIVVAKVLSSQLPLISALMHDEFNRCGGFVFHSSENLAKEYVSQLQTVSSKAQIEYSIDNGQTVDELMAQLNGSEMIATVNSLSSYNNRFYTTQEGTDISVWLRDEWTSIASTRDDISVSLFEHASWPQSSVIATINGTTNAGEIVVIGGHLDSINGSNPVSGRAPGADDNASGIAVITAALKAIVSSGYKPARTIKIMGYAAEEVGLRGSAEIAAQHRNEFLNVVGVSQFDMTGFKGTATQDITLISDFTNAAQNQYLTELMDEYLPEISYGFDICGYGCSDHASWNNQGFPASFPFEATFDDSNSSIHTSGDNSFNSLHALKFAKLAVTYIAEMGKGSTTDEQLSSSIQFAVSELSVDEGESVTIELERNGDITSTISIDYNTENGTAIAGTDYTATSGVITWEAQDETNKSISISTQNIDTSKAFRVLLSNPSGNSEIGVTSSITVNIVAEAETPVTVPPSESSSGGGGSLGAFGILLIALLNGRKNKKR
jgi:leucyl aminopeptidase